MSWNNPPINFSFRILKDADALTKKITAAMLQQVVMRSPVDTGAFRGNHRVMVGRPDFTYDRSSVDKAGNNVLQKGLGTIQAGGGIGKVVYISNSLPYSVRLERGWSMQAPAGVYSLSFKSVLDKYR